METAVTFAPTCESPAQQTPGGAAPNTNSALLGAAVATTLGLFGFVVPLAAAACRGVMTGLVQPMPPPTRMVIEVSWWWIVIAAAIAGALIVKERFVSPRRTVAMNAAMLILLSLAAAATLLAVVMPLLSLGNSLSPGG